MHNYINVNTCKNSWEQLVSTYVLSFEYSCSYHNILSDHIKLNTGGCVESVSVVHHIPLSFYMCYTPM